MGNQLEKQLGEFSGILQGLVPAIERLEARQNKTECEASAVVERVEGMRREIEDQKNRCGSRAADLYKKCSEAVTGHQENVVELQAVEKEIEILKNKDEGFFQKAWDIFKIIFTVALTAFVTWYLTKRG